MALEQAQNDGDPEKIELANDVIQMSVLAIVFLAPLGALVMMLTGPRLLTKSTDEEHRRRRELSYVKILSLQPVKHPIKTASNINTNNNR